MKILYFDVETTGLDPRVHDIHQLAMIIKVDGKEVAREDLKVKPFNLEAAEKRALEVSGVTKEEIAKYPDPKEVYKKVISVWSKHVDRYDKADKFYPAGYNVKFDLEFLAQFFTKCGDKYGIGVWQNWRYIDPLPLLYIKDLKGELSLANYKLENVCNNYGIEIKAHDALSDIEATIKLINMLIK